VDPDGNLNATALRTAHSGGHGVGAIDAIDEETERDARGVLDELVDEFDDRSLSD
jgi:hypothetical protein